MAAALGEWWAPGGSPGALRVRGIGRGRVPGPRGLGPGPRGGYLRCSGGRWPAAAGP